MFPGTNPSFRTLANFLPKTLLDSAFKVTFSEELSDFFHIFK